MEVNPLKDLNIADRPETIPNFGMSHVMVYVECGKSLNTNRGRSGRFACKPVCFKCLEMHLIA